MITNDEGESEFDVRWAWADGDLEPGMTAVVRVRDEARNLPFVLPPLLRAVRRVVLVDNGSTDGTAAVARRVAEDCGAAGRLEVEGYPFAVARCGSEHLGTSATSVHSLAHFYNWSFARVRTGYALKWDGDMVLTDPAVAALQDLAWQLEAAEAIVRIPRHPLYLAGDDVAFLDLGLRNCEPWAWPNRPGYSFVKALEWELPLWSPDTPVLTLPDRSCLELKQLDADEFSHWSTNDFEASARTRRKQREWEVFRALAGGAAAAGRRRGDRGARRRARRRLRAHGLGGGDRLGRALGRRASPRRAERAARPRRPACAPASPRCRRAARPHRPARPGRRRAGPRSRARR